MRIIYRYLLDHIRGVENMEFLAKPLAALTCMVLIVFVAWFAHFVTRKIFLAIVQRIAKRTKTRWDDILVENGVFKGLAHLVPAFILYYSVDFSYPDIHQQVSELAPEVYKSLSQDYYWGLSDLLTKISRIYFISIIVFVANSVLNAALQIYNTTEFAHSRPIKGYVQLVKIFVFFMAGILLIAALLGKDPTALLAGLGAIAAVLLLVFRDTILGFVASIQLSANDMVKIGDWIQTDGHNADGTVIDITLNNSYYSNL